MKGVFHLTRFLAALSVEISATAKSLRAVINIGSIDGLHVPVDGDLRLLALEGRGASVDAPPGQVFRADDHGQRHRARALRVQDDARDLEAFGDADRAQRRR